MHGLLVAGPLLALPKAPGRTTPGFRDGSRATFSFLPFMVRDESTVKARSPKPGHAVGKLATACILTQASVGDR